MLLAIDTSTRQASVALYDPGRGLLAEQSWFSANRHTEELMPAIAGLMRLSNATPRDLTAVGVAIGPGSFTGLRVGLAAAKGLALAQGVKLLGIPTLDVTAYPHQSQPVSLIAVAQAGRGRLYWAPYAYGPAGWGPQQPYALVDRDRGGEHGPAPDGVCGRVAGGRSRDAHALCRKAARNLPLARARTAPGRRAGRVGVGAAAGRQSR